MKVVARWPGALLAIACLFAFASASSVAKDKPQVPKAEAECKAKGGNWTALGLPSPGETKVCDLKATDAGRQCRSSKQCEGVCLAPEAAKTGSKARGQCSPFVLNFGNVHAVEGGVITDWNVE